MKKIVIIFIFTVIAFARDDGYRYNNNASSYINSNNQRYQSNSGTQYQYNMSNPSDRVQYSTDTDAQMRDRMNVNPYRSVDQKMGQVGGGIYED